MPAKRLAFLLLLCGFSMFTKAQTVEEIITKYISFTGGEPAWKKVHSLVTSGSYNYGGMVFPFTTYSKAPDKYKFIVPFKGKYFVQAFNGTKGWKRDAFKNETKKTILTGKPAIAMANEADVELESPLINYAKKGHEVTLEGKDTVEGNECFKVGLTRKNGDKETWFFSVDNYGLVKKQAISKNAELDNGLLDIFYSDYRTVQGIKIPGKMVSKLNGQTILTITVKKIALNTPIADATFEP